MILDDKFLLFLSLKWNDEKFEDDKYIINVFKSLYYFYHNIELVKNDFEDEHFFTQLQYLLNVVLNYYSDKLLNLKPSRYKEEFKDINKFLEEFERILMTLGRDYYREHEKHSKRVYFLGKFLYDILELQILNEELKDDWYIVSNTHDFCYILQDVNKILEKIENKITHSLPNLSFMLNYSITFGDIYLSEKHKEIFKILSTYGDSFKETEYLIYLEKANKRDHGLMSSLFVFDLLSSKKKYSIRKITPIVRGIALHTVSNTWTDIDIKSNCLAVLLMLCDEIQEWNRPYVDSGFKVHPNIFLENVKIPDTGWISERDLIYAIDLDSSREISLSLSGVQNPIKATFFLEKAEENWDFGLIIFQENSGGVDNLQNIAINMNTIVGTHIRYMGEEEKLEDVFLEEIKNNIKFEDDKAYWKITFISKNNNIILKPDIHYLKYLFSLYIFKLVNKKEPNRSTLGTGMDDTVKFIIPKLEEKEVGSISELDEVIKNQISKKELTLKRILRNIEDSDYEKIIILHEDESIEEKIRQIYPM